MPETLDRLRFFSDVPTFDGFQFPEAPPEVGDPEAPTAPTSRVQVAKKGTFKHPRYGKFTINAATFDSMIRNFGAGIPTDQLPADFDHEPDFGGTSEACGWVTKLDAEGDGLYATVEWRWTGAYAIREKAYRYVSPTWSLAYTDEAGEKHGPTLLAFGLTNRPYFRMPAVSLSATFSRDELGLFEQVEDDSPAPSDSRPAMPDFTKIAEVFGLAAEATEDEVLTAAREASEKAEQAPAEGQVLIAQAELDTLKAAQTSETKLAARVQSLETDAATQRFEAAFTAALTDSKGARVAPGEQESLRKFFDADEEACLASIAARQPIVNAKPTGHGGGTQEPAGEAPAGVDPDAFKQDQAVQAYMVEHPDASYATALDAVRKAAV